MNKTIINDWDEFSDEASWGELDDLLIPQDDYNGKDFYLVETNGNDTYYQLYIFVDEKSVYWGEATLTKDDIIRDGNDANPEWDEYMYEYDEFPLDLIKFKEWINKKLK